MLSAPLRAPVAVGVKVTVNVQLELAGNAAGQLLLCAKSPLISTELTLKAAVPVFVRVTVCATPAVFSIWLPNAIAPGEKVVKGAGELADVKLEEFSFVVVPPPGLAAVTAPPHPKPKRQTKSILAGKTNLPWCEFAQGMS